MKRSFLIWLYVTVFSAVALICATVVLFHCIRAADDPKSDIGDAPLFRDAVTYIENENGSVRLTDSVGFAFEFEVELYRDFQDIEFEIPLYGEIENRLIIVSTKEDSETRPRIYVDGILCDDIPTKKGRYRIRLDVEDITVRHFSVGNSMTVTGFGKIDILCMY